MWYSMPKGGTLWRNCFQRTGEWTTKSTENKNFQQCFIDTNCLGWSIWSLEKALTKLMLYSKWSSYASPPPFLACYIIYFDLIVLLNNSSLWVGKGKKIILPLTGCGPGTFISPEQWFLSWLVTLFPINWLQVLNIMIILVTSKLEVEEMWCGTLDLL